jgi:hypothetical protein
MADDDIWAEVQAKYKRPFNVTGAINVALLFGTAVIAITLILTPILSNMDFGQQKVAGTDAYDNLVTGSISKPGHSRNYTVRRSVLQEMPGAVCIINGDGTKSGC